MMLELYFGLIINMKKLHLPPVTCKKYSLKKFKVKPSGDNYFRLYLSEEYIGYFNTSNSSLITTKNNGRQKYFFIRKSGNIKIGGTDVIGTIAFKFNDDNKRWKIDYVTLTEIPTQFKLKREVLIEKYYWFRTLKLFKKQI
jgi:hypothetical protein